MTAEATGFKRFESKQNKLDFNTSLAATPTVGNVVDTMEAAATAE
jgi:hypothetical protein